MTRKRTENSLKFCGLLFVLTAFCLFLTSSVNAQIIVDNVSESGAFRQLTDPQLTAYSFSHQTRSGFNRALFVGISTSADPLINIPGTPPTQLTGTLSPRVIAVRYNGLTLERVGTQISPNLNNSTEIFRLIAPPVGTFQVEIDLNSGLVNNIVAGAVTLNGVLQSAAGQDLNFYSNSGASGTMPNVTVPRGNESLVLDVLGISPNAGVAGVGLNNDQTELYNGENFFFNSYSIGAASLAIPTNSGTTTRWRLTSNSDWSLGATKIFSAPLSPTAAAVSVNGRVQTKTGRGIARARITLTDSSGQTRSATTNFFGYYRFENVSAGETYILNVSSKSYSFAPQVLAINEEISQLNIIAQP